MKRFVERSFEKVVVFSVSRNMHGIAFKKSWQKCPTIRLQTLVVRACVCAHAPNRRCLARFDAAGVCVLLFVWRNLRAARAIVRARARALFNAQRDQKIPKRCLNGLPL